MQLAPRSRKQTSSRGIDFNVDSFFIFAERLFLGMAVGTAGVDTVLTSSTRTSGALVIAEAGLSIAAAVTIGTGFQSLPDQEGLSLVVRMRIATGAGDQAWTVATMTTGEDRHRGWVGVWRLSKGQLYGRLVDLQRGSTRGVTLGSGRR